MDVILYNSLTQNKEAFTPVSNQQVSIYTCGPTVYDYAHIGNFRTYTTSDLVVRVFKFNGYKVRHVMNLTDVGHLSGDNLGDADIGEDRVESAAEEEGKSAREITDFYITHFMSDYERLNLEKPVKFTRATEYIQEQIDLIRELERKHVTYRTSDGIYFDTSKYSKYGELSGYTEESIKEGARIEPNPEKRNPSDFALWKFSPEGSKRWQEWNSPWGIGFPGWHVECSAMSMKELGETLDVHIGGEDLKMIHHQNEIAQSECATGKTFSNYWLHAAFLQVDGGRMGKSLGNFYTVSDIVDRGFNPLSLRFFYMSAHYRTPLNFTWTSLQSADNTLKKLYSTVAEYRDTSNSEPSEDFIDKFKEALNDDINMPKALAVVWELIGSDESNGTKLVTLLRFDKVLGLDLDKHVGYEIPQKVADYARTRLEYRKAGIWDKADDMRKKVEELGFLIEDAPEGYKIKKKL